MFFEEAVNHSAADEHPYSNRRIPATTDWDNGCQRQNFSLREILNIGHGRF